MTGVILLCTVFLIIIIGIFALIVNWYINTYCKEINNDKL